MTEHTPRLAVLRMAYLSRWEDSEARAVAAGEFDRCIRDLVQSELLAAANDPRLRLSGHSGISISRLRARATSSDMRETSYPDAGGDDA